MTWPRLIDELATGMFSLMADAGPCLSGDRIEVEVTASNAEDLVVEVLSELLYEAEARDLILCQFQTKMLRLWAVRVTAGGIPTSELDPIGPPIKAVTYHDVAVEEREGEWYGRVYFDV